MLLLREHIRGVRVGHYAPQRTVEQGERLQRLAQIVAGGREEAALGFVGAIGTLTGLVRGVLRIVDNLQVPTG